MTGLDRVDSFHHPYYNGAMSKRAKRRVALNWALGLSLACLGWAGVTSLWARGSGTRSLPVRAPSEADCTWVVHSNAIPSCSIHGSDGAANAGNDLRNKNIPILDAKVELPSSACETESEKQSAFLIPRSRLAEAQALGYRER
jgi:hypothetical protein